jgi:hypothetical protein
MTTSALCSIAEGVVSLTTSSNLGTFISFDIFGTLDSPILGIRVGPFTNCKAGESLIGSACISIGCSTGATGVAKEDFDLALIFLCEFSSPA